jgi:hypothetical protein
MTGREGDHRVFVHDDSVDEVLMDLLIAGFGLQGPQMFPLQH